MERVYQSSSSLSSQSIPVNEVVPVTSIGPRLESSVCRFPFRRKRLFLVSHHHLGTSKEGNTVGRRFSVSLYPVAGSALAGE